MISTFAVTVKDFLLLYEKKSKFKPNISDIAMSTNEKRVYHLAGGTVETTEKANC
jgi:hypothetical protein